MPEADSANELTTLIQRAADGEDAAWNDLLLRASGRLTGLARRMLRNYPQVHRWEQTDDVFQNAFIRLHRSLSAVRPDSTRGFFGLAATQTRRTLIDLARHYYGPLGAGAHHQSNEPASQHDRQLPDHADPHGEPDSLQDWVALHEAVGRLPDEEREVFELAWYGGLAQKDIADALGVSVPTVQRRLYRARLSLRADLTSGDLSRELR